MKEADTKKIYILLLLSKQNDSAKNMQLKYLATLQQREQTK